ncbi:ScbA/BarX family gamma-butyrolactone biosynthesis protein [Streptomyces sp. SP18CS02]|uniref:ScbA/BarX family gamma-butyrolactone biosynthesis protein n=1 Tax=Streptomyces sp. SP18CS02 TaxID=3002531 RepID=UPI002E771A8E|nr:ScbA/BarX family gamma-butyrolactone biosynthesis protein [Streptomyces sp. SP18CS02]MEE1756667.1 ScbA/BarX family gamma-butyrolactone biosynthesis protein [Streptomyces sp. SP18CS02]
MSETVVASSAEPALHIRFAHTVDRHLVHRAAVAEVFVTDARQIGDSVYLAGAQTPLSHSYYNDHLQKPAITDVLLVLEACRQAAVCAAHTFLDIPMDTSFLVNEVSVQLDDPEALRTGGDPGELQLLTEYPTVRMKADRARKVGVAQELTFNGRAVGTSTMQVSALTKTEYRALREYQRGGVAPSTREVPRPDRSAILAPEQVGRTSRGNVVLASPAFDEGRLTAQLVPDFENRSLFDHEYDHYPAMTLLEGARQLGLLAAFWRGRQLGSTHVLGVDAAFLRFAELDAPVVLSATMPQGDGNILDVAFEQSGRTIATASVRLYQEPDPRTGADS